MFSSRFTFSLATNRLSKILARKRARNEEILDLTASNPTCAGFVYNETEVLAALSLPQALLYEPDPRGLLAARQAVADYYRARGEPTEAQHIHLTASTSEGYAYLFKLLANPGDEIFVPQPAYPLLDFLTALESVRLVHYPLRYEAPSGWRIDFDKLAASVSTHTRAIVVINPNNPTGSFLKQKELQQLNALCARHELALISDEVFSDYVTGPDPTRVASMVGNHEALTFVLSGLSKISALPQVKLGWIHVNGPQALRAEAQERLDFIADTYLSVATPVQHAAERLLALRHDLQAQIQRRVASNEQALRSYCNVSSACHVLKREGGWYALVAMPEEIEEEGYAVRLLEEENVLLHPGYFFDFPQTGFMVISLLTPPEVFQEGVARMTAQIRAMIT